MNIYKDMTDDRLYAFIIDYFGPMGIVLNRDKFFGFLHGMQFHKQETNDLERFKTICALSKPESTSNDFYDFIVDSMQLEQFDRSVADVYQVIDDYVEYGES